MSSWGGDFIPIYERFDSAQHIIDQISQCYPAQASDYLMQSYLRPYGRGAEAYVFSPGDCKTVVKFTQSLAHAKVSNYLAKHKIQRPHIVRTYEVAHLPQLGLWMIVEEILHRPDPIMRTEIEGYFTGQTAPMDFVDNQVSGMIQDLSGIGVREWREDCVAAHNILVHPITRQFMAFDFGFTKTDFNDDFDVWP